jgi:hypothetical protein
MVPQSGYARTFNSTRSGFKEPNMPKTSPSPRTEVHRKPQRADYDGAAIAAIIDEALICHVAFTHAGSVHCLPMACWRLGDYLYIHGASNARIAAALLVGESSVCITHLDGLVLARSAFHHSMNFRSAVIYGRFEEVTEPAAKAAAFEAFVEHVSPGRTPLVRPPSPAEMSGTCLLRIALQEASAKMRTGGVIDAEGDMAIPVWAGVIPLALQAGPRQVEPECSSETPPVVPAFLRKR